MLSQVIRSGFAIEKRKQDANQEKKIKSNLTKVRHRRRRGTLGPRATRLPTQNTASVPADARGAADGRSGGGQDLVELGFFVFRRRRRRKKFIGLIGLKKKGVAKKKTCLLFGRENSKKNERRHFFTLAWRFDYPRNAKTSPVDSTEKDVPTATRFEKRDLEVAELTKTTSPIRFFRSDRRVLFFFPRRFFLVEREVSMSFRSTPPGTLGERHVEQFSIAQAKEHV